MAPSSGSSLATTGDGRAASGRFLARRIEAAELLDGRGHHPVELAGNLRDIRLVNRFGGGAATVLRHLPDLMRVVPPERPVTILDLATGSGDIPLAIAKWAARRGRVVEITVSDASPEILDEARRRLAGTPGVRCALWDALAVPMPDRSFDVVLCSLALHHFAPGDAVRLLREMDRLAATGLIVNDIRRSLPGFAVAWVASRVATRNRLTRHDMPLSVRRAYTPQELRMLGHAAGLAVFTISCHPLFRMALVARR
jgi:SAM-dependent methyltransferase